MKKSLKLKMWVLLVLCSAFGNLMAAYPFSDDFEAGTGNWTGSGLWGLTTAKAFSPTHALTDSPASLYKNNTDASYELATSLDLTSAQLPVLRFHHRFALEQAYDFGLVEVSIDGGATWQPAPIATYSGECATWQREQLDLCAYAGESDLRVRFRVLTDSSVIRDGWYIDDIRIDEAPAAPESLNAVSSAPNAVSLSWPLSVSEGVTAYRVYRAEPGAVDWRTARMLVELGSTATNYCDIAVTPKTTYAYRVMAINDDALHGLSAEAVAVTAAGVDFPFMDDGESGASLWNADAPWALSDDDAYSGSHSWSDSPYTNYENSINISLQLAAPLDLTGSAAPRLGFISKYDFMAGDSGHAEASVNGNDWISLKQFTGSSQERWRRESFDLSAYTHSTTVFLRFRLTTDASIVTNGWNIDDISVAESPDPVPAPILDQIQSHSIRLSWQQSSDALFSHYAIYRSTTSGVGINDTLAATVSNQTATVYTDAHLALDTEYYYRVYAVSVYGAFSADGTESHAHTLNNPLPFTDDFEDTLIQWNLTGNWGVQADNPHHGTNCLSDSPYTEYLPGMDSVAQTAVDLSGTTWPVLKFWDRFELAAGDWIKVEISKDGSTWHTRYGSYEHSRADWRQQQIDLSEWRDEPNVRLRFHIHSDGSAATTADGWSIDEVEVVEHLSTTIDYPLYEGFEAGADNWLRATWMAQSNVVRNGSQATGRQFGRIGDGDYMSNLGAVLSLSNAVSPQLVFWLKGTIGYRAGFYWQASIDDGKTWSTITGANLGRQTFTEWTRHQVSLAAYTDQNIRLRYYVHTYSNNDNEIYIDDIAIENQTPNTVQDIPVPHLKSIDLSWAPSTIGETFKRYEIYRNTSPAVSLADGLVFSSTDVNAAAYTDAGLSIGAKYYYRLYVVNSNEVYSSGHESSATTVPLPLGLTDPMETMDNWDATGDWGVDTTLKYSGAASIGDSPADNYQPNVDSYILTAVDLSGTTWPVLKFRDRFELSGGDWIKVEISDNGSTWHNRYGSYEHSRADWRQQRIDLSEWKGEPNVRIRFHIHSNHDAATTANGWNIDEVEIVEHLPAAIGYPLYEGFEAGADNWLQATWMAQSNVVRNGSQATGRQFGRAGGGDYMSNLGVELSLSNAVSPQLVFWLKGTIGYRSGFYWQASIDDGKTWSTITGANLGRQTFAEWTRHQVSLAAYTDQNIRLRYYIHTYSNNDNEIYIDDIAVENQTPNVVQNMPVPHLKRIDLSWAPSTIGETFKRYEIYRNTSPNVSLADGLVFSSTDVNAAAYTDAGLSIGAKYYYRLYVVNSNEVYSSGHESSATTVPLPLGLTDPMETMDNWDATGDWGVDTTLKYSGAASIGDSPADNYQPNVDSYLLTAVDLSGTTWPVLKFRDRFELSGGDWIKVEISMDGSTWHNRYGSYEHSRTDWRQQRIDLSEWKGEPNVRIRFHIHSNHDAATTANGWNIDEVEIVEHLPAAIAYPLYEGFEAGADNWLQATWMAQSNVVRNGSQATGRQFGRAGGGDYMSNLSAALSLSNAVSPQLVYWLKGAIGYRAGFNWQASSDDGKSWSTISGAALGSQTFAEWTRHQVSLAAYTDQNIRLRYYVHTYGNNANEIYIDDIAIENQTPNVVQNMPVPHLKRIDLSWTPSTIGENFERYEIYRDTNPAVSLADELVFSSTDVNAAAYTDAGLSIGAKYYYRLYVVNSNEVYSSGHEQWAITTPHNIGLIDGMETMDNWYGYPENSWGVDTTIKHSGAASIGDSPADNYQPNVDSYLLTSVDLSGTTWPVLKFRDRFELSGGDWIKVEISMDGSTWHNRYGSYEHSRADWRQQRIDLSEWKGEPNVRIRFYIHSNHDANTTASGWNIDEVEIAEHTPAAIGYPLREGFEAGADNWLQATWMAQSNVVYKGTQAVGRQFGRIGGGDYMSNLGAALNLSNAVSPQLVYWLQGTIGYRSAFNWQVSTDDGKTWSTISGATSGAQTFAEWTRHQVSLAEYAGQRIRLRYYISTYSHNDNDIKIDDIGIGEPSPDAPLLNTPKMYESVSQRRPTVSVFNAIDYQGDNLDYEFEVYSDSLLSNLVANVPVLSSGSQMTSWEVDEDLSNNAQYWWRCRASDGVNIGDWMTTATFYVNQDNTPPTVVQIVGPSAGSNLRNGSDKLLWYPATDIDAGDRVVSYQLQIAATPDFTEIVLDDPAIVLGEVPEGGTWAVARRLDSFAGFENLVNNTVYYWRLRASDTWNDYSAWSAGNLWFTFGTPPPNLKKCSFEPDGSLRLEWENPGVGVRVEYKEDLSSAEEWVTLEAPVYGTSIVIAPIEGRSSGFFRVKTME